MTRIHKKVVEVEKWQKEYKKHLQRSGKRFYNHSRRRQIFKGRFRMSKKECPFLFGPDED